MTVRKYYATIYGLEQAKTQPSIALNNWTLDALALSPEGMTLRALSSYLGYGNKQGDVKQALEELMDDDLVVFE